MTNQEISQHGIYIERIYEALDAAMFNVHVSDTGDCTHLHVHGVNALNQLFVSSYAALLHDSIHF